MHHLGAGAEAIVLAKKLKNKAHIRTLRALANKTDPGIYYVNFAVLATELGASRSTVRRATRHLARTGLAEYAKGLWDESGPAGAGYSVTALGKVVLQLIDEPQPLEE